jgi:hypothetical protein
MLKDMKTLVSLASASLVVLLLAQSAFAQQDDPLNVPQGAPDPQSVALAYGDLSVFVLNVAAGNDGVTYNAPAEAAVRDALAEPVAAAYPSLSADNQQTLVQFALLDAQLHQAWPSLPDTQRGALRDQWAAQIQPVVSGMTCEDFDALSRARLLPSFGHYHDLNLHHLLECWNQHPELARDNQGNPLQRGSASASAGGSGSHAAFVSMMNANMMNFAANMNIASNMGTGEWSYTTH